MRTSLLLGVFLTILAPSSLPADWQYTKWGMTKEQVIAASGGAAEMATPNAPGDKPSPCRIGDRGILNSGSAGARGRYETAGMRFDACFYFDGTGGLSGIELTLDKERVAETTATLYDLLFQKYGKPEKEETNRFRKTYDWRTPSDRVTYWSVGVGDLMVTLVGYRPLSTSDGL